MKLYIAIVAAALALVGCAGGASGGAGAGGAAPVPAGGSASVGRTTLSGVFTQAQATRGQQQFARTCASCHSPSEFSGPVFQRVWSGRPVGELYEIMSTMMPQNDPGSLSSEQYADILSYFLRQNGYPEGAEELPGDREALRQVIFEPVS